MVDKFSRYYILKVIIDQTNASNISIDIYDLQSKFLLSKSEVLHNGLSIYDLDISSLSNGIYVYSIEVDGILLHTGKMNIIR
jgi:hypothetical protein